METSFDLQMNKTAEALFSGRFMNSETLGYVGGKILEATVGKQSTTMQHFTAGQGQWPALADSTYVDKRKKDKRIFVQSGKVLKAISKAPGSGEVMAWGSSADIHAAPASRKKKYVAGGLWATAQVGKTKLVVTTGFSGKLKHSTELNRMRRKIARDRTGGFGLTAKRVRTLVSVQEAHDALRKAGKGGRKYEAKGAKGIKAGKIVKATGQENLAYAVITQTGKFTGIETKGGVHVSPQMMGNLVRQGKKAMLPSKAEGYTRKFAKGQQRELMPYQDSDAARMSDVIAQAVSDIFRTMGGS